MLNKLHLAMIDLYRGDPKRIQHFCKVHSYTKLIAETEGLDSQTQFILEAAALTHDIGIHYCEENFGSSSGKLQEREGPAIAKKLLGDLGFPEDVSQRVQYLIGHHHTYDRIEGMDYQILVEADFLVNILEDRFTPEATENAFRNIFKTETGKQICKLMYGLQSESQQPSAEIRSNGNGTPNAGNNSDNEMGRPIAQTQNPNYAKLLEMDYSNYKTAKAIIQDCREDGISDKEIYEVLKSFY